MGVEEADKIIRIPGETLQIKLSPEEKLYREKYLPDPKNLTDDKLVCTVCSVSLAFNVHKGKNIFVHRVLQVLVCEACYTFYGDGCFSTDEDGDDKYCRWCGQGGTLYLCSACNCAFCQKCVKQNLKASKLAELKNDDWKCYICNPRPLYGCRTICWGAEELNKIGKAKEEERIKKLKEKQEKRKDENGKRSRKTSVSEDELSTKKRKTRARNSDSSSPEVMPTKRQKRDSRTAETGSLNGSVNRARRRRKDSSSDNETSDVGKKVSKPSRHSSKINKKYVGSSSEEDSDLKSKNKSKLKKKKGKESSDDSSDEDKKKAKRKSSKKKGNSSDDESFDDDKHTKKKRLFRKKKEDTSDSSADEKVKKKKSKKKKKETSSEESSDNYKKKSRKQRKKKNESSDDNSDDDSKKIKRKTKSKNDIISEKRKKDDMPDSDDGSKKEEKDVYNAEESVVGGKNLKDSSATADAIVKKRIKLAILWLNNTVKDISELGTLISMRATKFSAKKINTENLKTYDDVLNTINKLKQLISGVHSNYEHIEKSLDAHVKPWKIHAGLEEPDGEKTVEGEINKPLDCEAPKVEEPSSIGSAQDSVDCSGLDAGVISSPANKTDLEMVVEDADSHDKLKKTESITDMALNWSEMSADDDSDNESTTRALISKANETLDKEDNDLSDGKDVADTDKKNQEVKSENVDKTILEPNSTLKSNQDETLKSKNSCIDNSKASQSDSDENQSKPVESETKNKTPNKSVIKISSESTEKNEKRPKTEEATPKKSITTKETDSESKMETSPSGKTTPDKTGSKEKSEGKSKGQSDQPTKKGHKETLKEESVSPAAGSVSQKTRFSKDRSASSSEESTSLEAFSKRLKGKWLSDEQQPENMNLKTSLGLGSSGDSDVDLDPSTDENKKIVLKKKSEDKVKHNEDVKKKQIKKEEDKNSSQKNDKKRKLKNPDTKLSKNIDRNSSDDEIAKKTKKESKKSCEKDKKHKKDKEMTGDGDVESLSNRREHNKNTNKEDSERNRLKKQKEVTKDECKAKKRDDTDEDPAENRKRVKKNKEIQQDANKEKGDNDDDDPTENMENVMKNKEIQQHANKDKEDTAIEDLSKSVEKSKKNKKKNQEDGEGNQLKKLKKVTKDDSKAKDGDNTDDEDPAGNMKNVKKNKEIQQDANKEKGDTDDDDPAENLNKNNEIQQNANTEKEETAIEDPAENVEKSKKKNKEDRIRNQTKKQKVNAVKNGSTNSHVDSDENKKRSKQYSEVKTQKHGDVEIKEEDRSDNEDVVDKVENLGNVEENCEEIKGDDEEKQDSDDEDANKKYEQYLKNMEKNKPVLLTLDSSSEEIDEKDAAKEDKVARNVDKEKKKNKTVVVTLDSSSEEIDKKDVAKEDKKESKGKEKSLKKRSELNDRRPRSTLLSSESSDEDGPPPENRSCSDKENKKKTKKKEKDEDDSVSPSMLSSGDSSDSEIIPQKKIRKKETSSDDDLEVVENKKTKKRKRVRCADSSDESGGSGLDPSQKSSKGESPGKGGRKNIKKIKDRDDLEAATKEAAEEEKERRKRIEERQKLFNQMFEIKETKILDKLVLDFDPKEKKELLSVHQDLVEKMKPHQAKGVKFMWDSCFESLSQLKSKKGSGCILAHCMGLGKTFQVISLVHTILNKEETNVHTVMVVCPLSTVLNWYNEFGKWLDGVEGGDDIKVFHLTRYKLNPDRARELRRWQHNGGVLIIGYEMFRNLTCETNKKFKARMKKDFLETLIDPGADLIVCDEGHMLKNEATALSKAMSRVKTMRRVVLTGTPMQNNLKEYHCMVQFVKPSLLGTRKEFLNRFVNPITNGQFVDSTPADVKVMKRRAHVLHKMLEGLVQRFDYNVLTPFLPPKHEYVISLCLTELQEKLYRHYLENLSQKSDNTKAGSRLFQDWQALGRIWTHPRVLKMSTDKANWLKEKKALEESDSEGSLKDFIDDDEDNTTSEESSDDDNSSVASIKSDEKKKKKPTRKPVRQTRSMRLSGKNTAHLDSSEDEKEEEVEVIEETSNGGAWWGEMVEPQDLDDIRHSSKLTVLFAILKECEMIEDKVLVFSQSLFSLDLIEHFLDKIDEATQKGKMEENLGNHQGTWSKGLDYFRLDGSTSSENRNIWCNSFNREDNPRARLFLISTRAGGLGINLTAANRVIIFDASWNPSHDVQSIFRIYRFGQKKPCYVYRFIAHGTMEERVYDRQVAKQSMSNRVVDEQQVHRHFSMNDLNELYTFTPATKKEDRPTPALPKDGLMAEILSQFSDSIEKYHEHDSLLENVVEEELNEEERQLAWEDYENDKKRATMPAYNTGAATNSINNRIEYMRQTLKAQYPDKPEQELHQMLIIHVSMMMKQQQMDAAAAGTQGSTANFQQQPQMYNKNLTPEQLYMQQQQMRMQYLQQMQAQQAANMQQSQSKGLNYQQQMMMQQQQQANLARLQMQQMQQKMSQQSLLQTQLSQPMKSAQMMNKPTLPRMNSLPFQALELERMKNNYQASRQQSPGVKITELPEESKPSDSST